MRSTLVAGGWLVCTITSSERCEWQLAAAVDRPRRQSVDTTGPLPLAAPAGRSLYRKANDHNASPAPAARTGAGPRSMII